MHVQPFWGGFHSSRKAGFGRSRPSHERNDEKNAWAAALLCRRFTSHGALFPQLHVLHLLTAGTLKFLAGKRSTLLEAPLRTVGSGIKPMEDEVFFGNNLEGLAAFKADDALFL